MAAIDLIGNIMCVDHPADFELVEVVHHVLAQHRQHAFPVAAVEGGVVAEDEFCGAVLPARAVDLHGGSGWWASWR